MSMDAEPLYEALENRIPKEIENMQRFYPIGGFE